MKVSSFSWDSVERGANAVNDDILVDFYTPTVSNRDRHRLTTTLRGLKHGEMFYHLHKGTSPFSIWLSTRSRRMNIKFGYTNRDVKAIDPRPGEVRDGFILRHNPFGKRRYFNVKNGVERSVRPSSVPKLKEHHYWIWRASADD